MIELDVDMEYCLDVDMLGCIILHDENGEMDDMVFVPERTCRWEHIEGTWFMSECGKRYDRVVPDNYCPNCGAKVEQAKEAE